MTLHVFNPEHDIALAANLSNFTAPRAGRQLRHDLANLPELWASDGDLILTDDVVTLSEVDNVEPWGWDRALCAELKRRGVSPEVLPNDKQLQRIRELSHRRTAAQLLQSLLVDGTVGEVVECHTIDEVLKFLQMHSRVVLKAPWSSSGRGVRFVSQQEGRLMLEGATPPVLQWAMNVQKAQGSLMAEPYYDKVEDLAMEFYADESGHIAYRGLSLFQTSSGAYTGNLLTTESSKEEFVNTYIPVSLLNVIRQKVQDNLLLEDYQGPFGIDMMIVRSEADKYLLHPCVELNLRRTMGHVALALHKKLNPEGRSNFRKVMRIVYNGQKYELKIE